MALQHAKEWARECWYKDPNHPIGIYGALLRFCEELERPAEGEKPEWKWLPQEMMEQWAKANGFVSQSELDEAVRKQMEISFKSGLEAGKLCSTADAVKVAVDTVVREVVEPLEKYMDWKDESGITQHEAIRKSLTKAREIMGK